MDDKSKYTYQAIQHILTTGKDPKDPDRFYTQQELYELVLWLNGGVDPDNQKTILPREEEVEEQKVEIASQALDLNETNSPEQKQRAWEQVLHHNEVLRQTNAPPIPAQVVSEQITQKATQLASKTLSPEIKGKINDLLNKIPQIPDVESVVKKKAVQGLSTRIAARLGLASLGVMASAGVYLLVEAGVFILNKAKDLLRSGLIKLTGDRDGSNLATVSLGAAALGIFFPPAFGLALVTGGLSYIQGGSEGFKKAGRRSVLLFLAIMGAVMSVVIWPIVISLIAIPLFIAFSILVITNSSYVVPPGDLFTTGVGTAGIGGAYPHCWPAVGVIKQGPNGSFSHTNTQAIDIANVEGSHVYATHDGTATTYEYLPTQDGSLWMYGKYVVVESPLGFSTYYAHLSRFAFTGTVEITAGTLIGYMGNTGNSTGSHLHYELRPNTMSINNYLPAYSLESSNSTQCQAKDAGGTSMVYTGEGCAPLVNNATTIANGLTLISDPVTDTEGHTYSHGVWDYWNHNSLYPNYWSEEFYRNPVNINQSSSPGATDIFWCTALVVETYKSAGFPFASYSQTAYVGNMINYFRSVGRYMDVNEISADQVPPGSVIFFGNHHVGMILNIQGQIVTIAESNSYPYGHPYDDPGGQGRNPINNSRVVVVNNKIVTAQGGYQVTGYGLPPAECYTN